MAAPPSPWQNTILISKNTISAPASAGVAARIAGRTLARREADYTGEVRRLLDAGLEVMRRSGTAARPKVADIVAAAGSSNDAFYRHFPSKEALVAAIIEDGAERLRSYLVHQMAKVPAPEEQVRRWVDGVLAQAADGEIASTTLAVLWNAGSVADGLASGHSAMNPALAGLLVEPFGALGSVDPERDAALCTHAVVGILSDHLWQRARATSAEIDHVVDFCLRAVVRSGSS